MSPTGTELFYRLGTAVMAVDLNNDGDEMQIGTPRELFNGDHIATAGAGVRQYHVGPDGRFLMQRRGDRQDSEGQPPNQVVLVQNWSQELTERVPIP